MQHSSFTKNGHLIQVDWNNEGTIGVDQNGKVWQNIDNPIPFANPVLRNEPTGSDFLKPLFDNIEEILNKHKT